MADSRCSSLCMSIPPRVNTTKVVPKRKHYSSIFGLPWLQISKHGVKSVTPANESRLNVENQKRHSNHLEVSDRRWESVSVNLITDLPVTQKGHDSTCVVVDRLSKMVLL